MAFGQLGAFGRGFGKLGLALKKATTASLLALNSRLAILGNSRDSHINMRADRYWMTSVAGGRYYMPAGGNLSLAGDAYEGYLTRVNNVMASAPAILVIGDGTNNVAASQIASVINGHLDTLLAAIVAHANYATLTYIVLTTTPISWTLNTAQDTARQSHNAYIASLAGGKILVSDRAARVGYGDTADGLHLNANAAYTDGSSRGALLAAKLDAASAYPPIGAPATLNITGASNDGATGEVILTIASHGRSPGEMFHVLSMGGFTALNGLKWIVSAVPDANHIQILGKTTSAAGYTSGGTADFGFIGDNGSGLSLRWSATSGGGITFSTRKDTFNGKTYQVYAVTGTATADTTDERILFGPTVAVPIGAIHEGWARIRVTGASGAGAPVGLASLGISVGQAKWGGSVDALTLTCTAGANETIVLDFYNTNQIPLNPANSMITDAGTYDVANGRISRLSVVTGSTNTTTIATAIAAAINGDAGLTAQGLTATSATNVVTVLQTTAKRSGTYIRKTSGATTVSIGANASPLTQNIDDLIVRMQTAVQTSAGASLSWAVVSRPIIGSVDYEIWVADPLTLVAETVAYAVPYDQTVTGIFTAPTLTLAASVATAQSGVFSGGAIVLSYEVFKSISGTNPTGTGTPDSNPTGWATTGVTTNGHDFASDGLSGLFLIMKVTATNGLGSVYHWTSKTSGALP